MTMPQLVRRLMSAIACLRESLWSHAIVRRKVLTVNRSLTITAVLLVVSSPLVSQSPSNGSDCSTLKYLRHKVSCLCGTVQVCSGDICGRPSDYGLDDDITVQLRNKAGTTIIDSKKVAVEKRERECTTQVGTKVPCPTIEKRFCFDGKRDGAYQLAFIVFKNGVPQPAIKFPTNYSHTPRKSCDSVYVVEPSCP
jgi:hypothetical protein